MPSPLPHAAGALVACTALLLPSPPAAGGAASGADWAIDPARTRVGFSIDAVGYPRTTGEFRRFDGRISIDIAHPERSRVQFSVDTQSVDAGSASFNDYLRSEALLNADRYKEIVFASTSVKALDARTVAVTGDLTMLGVTRPLRVEVAIERPAGEAQARLGFTARAAIDRLAFGMDSGFPIVSRTIDLTVASEAVAR